MNHLKYIKDNNLKPVVGISGGKDSTATCLYLYDLGFKRDEIIRVFIDVGWEHPQTYKYIKELEKYLGPINTIREEISIPKEHYDFCIEIEKELGHQSSFIRQALKDLLFPSHFRKWCTRVLKIKPLKKFLSSLEDEPVNVNGIRREESIKRSKREEFHFWDHLDSYIWSPIINWNEKQVIDQHHKHGVKPNPLYLNQHNRVGCFPCIYAGKEDISNLTDKRVSIIKRIEDYMTNHLNRERKSTFYKQGNIEDVFSWSQTSYGGKQLILFDTRTPSCAKWGLCGI